MRQNQWQGIDRRQQPSEKEFLFRLLVVCSVISWLAFVCAMLVFHFARPEMQTGFATFLGLEQREHWEMSLTFALVGLLGLCFVLSGLGVFIKFKRARRQGDGIWLNVILLLAISTISLSWIALELN